VRSVEQQLALVTESAIAPEPVRLAITESLGLMCAEEVQATKPMPGFDQAAIDGYAIRAVDVGGERGLGLPADAQPHVSETSLPVVGEVAAGSQRPLRLQPKQAVRVHTGAPLPALSDAVIPLEWTDRGRKRVTAKRPVRSGEFVRRQGDDIRPGDVAVSAGAILSPSHIGLLAAVGRNKVLVYPRPRLTVISVGHELVDIDREPGLGQVLDVNSYAIAAAGREAGAEVLGIVSIFTYGMQKGLDRLAAADVKYISLTNFDVIAQVAAEDGYIKTDDVERLIKFRNNPSDESWIGAQA
jgi:molybdopterin molybdotransferase